MDEMWWRRGEDDGSLLSQMTEDAAKAGAAVRHYHKAVKADEMFARTFSLKRTKA